MYAIRHSLRRFGILGVVFFTAGPASAQCTDQWLPGEGLPGPNGDVQAGSFIDNDVPPSRSGQVSLAFTFDVTILGDLDGDGEVGIKDLLVLLTNWGRSLSDRPQRTGGSR